MNTHQRRNWLSVALLSGLVASAQVARAATITVTSTADNTTVDAQVTLREAIQAANSNLSVDGSTAGNGADTIVFAVGVTPTITLGSNLPTFTENVSINGPGANVLTVQGFLPTTNPDSVAGDFSVNSGVSANFSGLTISVSGGYGIRNNGGTVTITNCTFYGTATGSEIYISDGVRNFSGTATLADCTLRNLFDGLYSASGDITVNRCTMKDNYSGLSPNDSAVAIANCTFTGNSRGISASNNSPALLSNCTLKGNTYGLSAVGTVTIKNTICVDSSLGNFTLIQQGNNITSGDPLLGALANNGGPTQTMLPQPGSPAIDQGIGSTLPTDQRGFARPFDDPAIAPVSGGDNSDIGAVEVRPAIKVFINNVTMIEGTTGSTRVYFTISLSEPAIAPLTVTYATANGTATAGNDYTARTNSVTFNVGQNSKAVWIPVRGDTLVEGNETFRVKLSNPTSGVIGDGLGVCTIWDDD